MTRKFSIRMTIGIMVLEVMILDDDKQGDDYTQHGNGMKVKAHFAIQLPALLAGYVPCNGCLEVRKACDQGRYKRSDDKKVAEVTYKIMNHSTNALRMKKYEFKHQR